jgi:hypothetical protein
MTAANNKRLTICLDQISFNEQRPPPHVHQSNVLL